MLAVRHRDEAAAGLEHANDLRQSSVEVRRVK
jgi:hypothetical protein